MLVLVVTALLYFALRDNPRVCWLHISAATIQPGWTMEAGQEDLGENLRFVSAAWLLAAVFAAAFAVYTILKIGIQTPKLSRPRLSIQWILLAFFFISVAFAVARPPISWDFPVRITLPGLGFLATIAIAFCVRNGARRKLQRTRAAA